MDGQKEELSDIVQYLELEEQFSTKKSPVSEVFQGRRNQKYILNAKKAYNICTSHVLRHTRSFIYISNFTFEYLWYDFGIS